MLSNLLEPGKAFAGAPTATLTVVWAPEVPPGPPVADHDGLCRRPLPPQSMTRYSFILLSRERQLCVSFLPKEIMP